MNEYFFVSLWVLHVETVSKDDHSKRPPLQKKLPPIFYLKNAFFFLAGAEAMAQCFRQQQLPPFHPGTPFPFA